MICKKLLTCRVCLYLLLLTMCSLASGKDMEGARLEITNVDPSLECPVTTKAVGAVFLTPIATFFAETVLGALKDFFEKRSKLYRAVYQATDTNHLLYVCEKDSSGNPIFIVYPKEIKFAYGALNSTGNVTFGQPGNYPNRVELLADIDAIDEGTQHLFRIVPKKLIFQRPVSKKGDDKDLVFSISIEIPTAYNGEGKPAGVKFEKVIPPFEGLSSGQGEIDISGVTSNWFPVPSVHPDIAIEEDGKVLPFSMLVSATETENGIGPKIYTELAEQIDSNKEKIVKIVVGKVSGESSENADTGSPPSKQPSNDGSTGNPAEI